MMAEDALQFYEWNGLGENWITSEESFDSDYPSRPFDQFGQSVAAWVIETVFTLI